MIRVRQWRVIKRTMYCYLGWSDGVILLRSPSTPLLKLQMYKDAYMSWCFRGQGKPNRNEYRKVFEWGGAALDLQKWLSRSQRWEEWELLISRLQKFSSCFSCERKANLSLGELVRQTSPLKKNLKKQIKCHKTLKELRSTWCLTKLI